MPIFSRALEKTLRRAPSPANERRQIRDPGTSAAGADRRRRCGGRPVGMRRRPRCAAQDRRQYLDTELENLVVDSREAKATNGFQRVVRRAAFHVQSSGREEVTGANVLVAISPSARPCGIFPARAGHDPLRRGQLHQPWIAKRPAPGHPLAARRRSTSTSPRSGPGGQPGSEEKEGALEAYCVNLNRRRERAHRSAYWPRGRSARTIRSTVGKEQSALGG